MRSPGASSTTITTSAGIADITEIQLQKAPAFARQEDHDWSDLKGRDELDAHYDIPPHMRAI